MTSQPPTYLPASNTCFIYLLQIPGSSTYLARLSISADWILADLHGPPSTTIFKDPPASSHLLQMQEVVQTQTGQAQQITGEGGKELSKHGGRGQHHAHHGRDRDEDEVDAADEWSQETWNWRTDFHPKEDGP